MAAGVQLVVNGLPVDSSNPLPVSGLGGPSDGGISTSSSSVDVGLRNLVGSDANSVWPAGLSSWAIGAKYKANVASGGMAAGDVYLQTVQHSRYVPDVAQPTKYWTAIGATSWIKIFDGVTNAVAYVAGTAPADLTKCSVIESGLMLTQTWSRSRGVVSLNGSGAEVITTVTESRTVQSSHVYPYPAIDDTGWQ